MNLSKQKQIYIIILLAILYFVSGKLSLLFLHGNNIVNIGVFAAEGIALAFVLYFGPMAVLGVFIGQFFLAYSNDISTLASLSISTTNSFEHLIGYMLFKRFRFDIKLETFRDIFGLFLIIFIDQIIGASLANLILVITNLIDTQHFLISSFSWWFGNVMGQLLITPFLLLTLSNYKRINFTHYTLYGIFFSLYIYLLEITFLIHNTLLLLSLSLPIVVFIISKKGFVCGSLLSVIVALVSSYAVHNNLGAFALKDNITNVINYNLFVLAHISTVFVTGILFEAKKRYETTLHQTIQEEIKKNEEQQLLMLHQSRLAQMGEMIGMIAHQWRQPLNILSLTNQLLINKYNKEKLDSEAIEYFKETSKKQIDLMSKTIDDFRDFFKLESIKEEFVINDVVSNVLDMTKVIYQENGITIDVNIASKYKTLGYPHTMSQAILNILNNARDALLDKNPQEKKIKINLYDKENEIILEIEDTAGGIPQHLIEKIFDPYFSTKSEKNGTGLGLYMSKMIIVDKLNGDLRVKNTDQGALFTISLQKL